MPDLPIQRVIISGGGTGGHIHPALAIADEIKRRYPACDILFVGAKGRMEMEKVPAAGYPIEGLWITGVDRNWRSLRNWIFPLKLVSSLWKARQIIRRFRPELVVGVGGFASGPLLFQASKAGILTAIQEQNSFPGITNRLLAKRVQLICAGFPGLERWFPAHRIVETGNPLRHQVVESVKTGNREAAAAHFGFSGDRPIVFVMGGSLGAASMNAAVRSILDSVGDDDTLEYDVLWQSGARYHEHMLQYVNGLPTSLQSQVRCVGFIDRMDLAYQCADLIASRAGAMSIAELALVGKPTILVPSPVVAEDHQTKNARSLSDRGGAILVPDVEVIAQLGTTIHSLLADESRCQSLAKAITEAARPQAAQDVVNAIEALR
jgi:UDP-N-acetylglucosamine--N-acetylmuramyl-(pentapeptide) pyrophosphoryl-undecaprenol N-acetylglucosamine transferase